MKGIIISLLLSACLPLYQMTAQNATLDSLKLELRNHTTRDTTQVNLLDRVAFACYSIEPDSTLHYATIAYDLAEELNYVRGLARSARTLGVYYHVTSDFPKAVEYYEMAVDHFETLNDEYGLSATRNNLAILHLAQGEIEIAVDHLEEALKSFEKLGKKKNIAAVYNTIGTVYNREGDYPRSLEYYQKSLSIKEEIGDTRGVANALVSIGNLNEQQDNDTIALNYYQRAHEIFVELGDKEGISVTNTGLGDIYVKQNDFSKALNHFQETLRLFEELADKDGIIVAQVKIGNVYMKQHDYDTAMGYFQTGLEMSSEVGIKLNETWAHEKIGRVYFSKKNFEMANQHGKLAYNLAKEIGSIEFQASSAGLISESSSALGRYKEAYDYHIVLKTMSDSLFNEENVRKITGLEYQYQFDQEKQQAELEQQKLDAVRDERERRLRALRNSFIVGFILVSLLVGVVYRNFLQKRKANVQLAEQKDTIQAQANALEVTNEELAESNATKDKFFSIVAHDMKDPFNALLGLSDLLLKNYNDFTEKERQEFVKNINDSSAKTYKMVNNLLTWSRSQLGQIQFTPTRFFVNELIDEIVEVSALTAKQKDIQISKEIEDGLETVADRNMLEVVLRNLVSNAIKFTPRGGEVTVKARSVIKDQSESLEVIVVDNGVGIEKEYQSQLFGLSTNISTTGTENETGTGLGLIICKEFVQKHGGKIWLVSEKDKGSSFYFTIPAEAKAAESRPAQTG